MSRAVVRGVLGVEVGCVEPEEVRLLPLRQRRPNHRDRSSLEAVVVEEGPAAEVSVRVGVGVERGVDDRLGVDSNEVVDEGGAQESAGLGRDDGREVCARMGESGAKSLVGQPAVPETCQGGREEKARKRRRRTENGDGSTLSLSEETHREVSDSLAVDRGKPSGPGEAV